MILDCVVCNIEDTALDRTSRLSQINHNLTVGYLWFFLVVGIPTRPIYLIPRRQKYLGSSCLHVR
jgi:hypothetical protein